MNRKILILADGQLGVFSAKTATSVIRYRPKEVVAVLDREYAGRNTHQILGVPAAIPIVSTVEAGLAFGPDTLLIGIAPPGGQLPQEWRDTLRACLTAGLTILSGLHTFLDEDPELAALARKHGARIVDLRRPPEDQPIAAMLARGTRALRVLTVGTDCNVGKMVAALELTATAKERGIDARFLATGQTGMLIAGGGVTLDRIPGDFMAGHVEKLVVEQGDAELAVVEGQGSLVHPAYSSVTVALLHGALPDAMILVHHAGRETVRFQDVKIPPLPEMIRRYEDALAPLHPSKVVGIAINPYGAHPEEAADTIAWAEKDTGLPAVDVVANGAGRLLDAVLRVRRG